MSTSPKSPRHGIQIPFSISPRKLQELSLPMDGPDVTTASGLSMKEYEDQLNGLRKENFHLKLRIYFLEEKIGTGSPLAVQGLLEHNVRLQVEVEELKRQLTDKQELLAVAAEAIDSLEQQGSVSTESVDLSIDNTKIHDVSRNKINSTNLESCDELRSDSEAIREGISSSAETDDTQNEMARLKRENRRALMVIKESISRIKKQDVEIKKLKLNKELVYAQVSDAQLEKYEEIVKNKDQHIKELQSKVSELESGHANNSNENLQAVLTRRLQGLAYFLDKLLAHKCVLDDDKKKLAESILEQSLALPIGLKLDESMAIEDFTMDESNLDLSQSFKMQELTMMFGHHMGCGDDNRHERRRRIAPDTQSESEGWSEPDRNVSVARIGLETTPRAVHKEANRNRTRRPRLSITMRSEDRGDCEEALVEEVKRLMAQIDTAQEENARLKATLKETQDKVVQMEEERSAAREEMAQLRRESETAMGGKEEAERRAARAEEEQTQLRRAADEATVQASQAVLDRARANHERLQAEKHLDEARRLLALANEDNARLEHMVAMQCTVQVLPSHDEDDRPTSPDQGIDSDRLSSLEQTDTMLSPRSLYKENITLKQKLSRTKATLADCLEKLNASNKRKKITQRAICRQIHKTHEVLRKARDQAENKNEGHSNDCCDS